VSGAMSGIRRRHICLHSNPFRETDPLPQKPKGCPKVERVVLNALPTISYRLSALSGSTGAAQEWDEPSESAQLWVLASASELLLE